jgi:hypothetical protein
LGKTETKKNQFIQKPNKKPPQTLVNIDNFFLGLKKTKKPKNQNPKIQKSKNPKIQKFK